MRVKRITAWLVLGVAVTLAYAARRRRGAPVRRAVPPRASWRGTPAEYDATMLARADEAGELFIEAIAGWHIDLAPELEVGVTEPMVMPRDLGPDPDLDLDDHRAQAEGESWLEHLEASSAEIGLPPGRELDVIDDPDLHGGHHRTATTDTPVADHGSGGPRGL